MLFFSDGRLRHRVNEGEHRLPQSMIEVTLDCGTTAAFRSTSLTTQGERVARKIARRDEISEEPGQNSHGLPHTARGKGSIKETATTTSARKGWINPLTRRVGKE